MNHKAFCLLVVARLNLNFTFLRKFLGVFYQINQDLLDSSFIAKEDEWEFSFDFILYQIWIASWQWPLHPVPYKEQTVIIFIFLFYLVFVFWDLQVLNDFELKLYVIGLLKQRLKDTEHKVEHFFWVEGNVDQTERAVLELRHVQDVLDKVLSEDQLGHNHFELPDSFSAPATFRWLSTQIAYYLSQDAYARLEWCSQFVVHGGFVAFCLFLLETNLSLLKKAQLVFDLISHLVYVDDDRVFASVTLLAYSNLVEAIIQINVDVTGDV